MAGAGLVALLALAFWTQVIWSNAISMVTVADGQQARNQGRPEEALRLFNRSVDQSPSSAVARMALANALHNGVVREPDFGRQKVLLELADDEIKSVVDRNPLEWRAWFVAGNIGVDFARLNPLRGNQAVSASRTLVEIMPSRWEARLHLAWTLMQVGEHAQSLAVAQEARTLRAAVGNQAGLFYFVEATSLRALGRTEEALVATQRLSQLPDGIRGDYLEQLQRDSERRP